MTRGSFVALGLVAGTGACTPPPSAPNARTETVYAAIPSPPPPQPTAGPGSFGDGGDSAALSDAGSSTASVLETALTEWRALTQCDSFDYKTEGGIQNFWCHRPPRITFSAVEALAGVNVFASGPHANGTLDLDEKAAFGHYNPAFVEWLLTKATPSARGSLAQKATQSAYDAHLRQLAEIFWKTYDKMSHEPGCFDREKTAYAKLIASKKLPKNYYERWFFFMNPHFCGGAARADTFYFDNGMDAGVNGNVTKTVVGFWLRRSMDGTMNGFAEGLKKLVASYDPGLLTTTYRPLVAADLTKAVDAAMKEAASCKSPRAKSSMTSIDILVTPDGELHASPSNKRALETPEARCIEAAFQRQRVPSFSGHEHRMTRSISTTLPTPQRGRGTDPFLDAR